MDRMDGMGPSPILSVIHTVAIGTILNNNGDSRGHAAKCTLVRLFVGTENGILQLNCS